MESGLVHSPQNVYTEYPDPPCDEWKTKIVPGTEETTIDVSGENERYIPQGTDGREGDNLWIKCRLLENDGNHYLARSWKVSFSCQVGIAA